MRYGLYGKLPAKRDFVAAGVSREFLAAWEPWMQGGLSASRALLGAGWQTAFLRAPIWRFWLGADICGAPTLGAFMASVDGVGRYFPLTLVASPEAGETLPPPEFGACEEWLSDAERLLLAALGESASYESVTAGLDRLRDPPSRASGPGGTERLRGGALLAHPDPGALEATLAKLRTVDEARVYASMTYWWTVGGEGFDELALASRRMPDPHLFAGMLTGRFDGA